MNRLQYQGWIASTTLARVAYGRTAASAKLTLILCSYGVGNRVVNANDNFPRNDEKDCLQADIFLTAVIQYFLLKPEFRLDKMLPCILPLMYFEINLDK